MLNRPVDCESVFLTPFSLSYLDWSILVTWEAKATYGCDFAILRIGVDFVRGFFLGNLEVRLSPIDCSFSADGMIFVNPLRVGVVVPILLGVVITLRSLFT